MNLILNRRLLVKLWGSLLSLSLLAVTAPVLAADMAADIFVKQLSDEVVETIKSVFLRRPHRELWFSFCCRRQVSVQIEDVLLAADKNLGLWS